MVRGKKKVVKDEQAELKKNSGFFFSLTVIPRERFQLPLLSHRLPSPSNQSNCSRLVGPGNKYRGVDLRAVLDGRFESGGRWKINFFSCGFFANNFQVWRSLQPVEEEQV